MKNTMKSSFLLLSATVIWGSAFVAQRSGMDHIGPFTFQAVRCALGAAALVLLSLFLRGGTSWRNKQLWIAGSLCGAILFVAAGFQQAGLQYTSAGKAGFITAMYIIFVPILDLFLGKKVPWAVWISVVLSVCGLYCLSCTGLDGINKGDVLMLFSAVSFAVQILLIGRFAPGLDAVRFNAIQSGVCAALSALVMLFTETPTVSGITDAWGALCFAGVLSMGVAYTFQIMGQRDLHPAVASLIMSMESVFAALTGWLILRERLSPVELLGCLLVFSAVLLTQLPTKTK